MQVYKITTAHTLYWLCRLWHGYSCSQNCWGQYWNIENSIKYVIAVFLEFVVRWGEELKDSWGMGWVSTLARGSWGWMCCTWRLICRILGSLLLPSNRRGCHWICCHLPGSRLGNWDCSWWQEGDERFPPYWELPGEKTRMLSTWIHVSPP